MRQRFLLASVAVLGLGVLSVVYAGTIQDRRPEKVTSVDGIQDAAAEKAADLAEFLATLKQDGLASPRTRLQSIQDRIQADPAVLDDPKLAVPLYNLQTELIMDMVNAENLTGPERVARLNSELAALGDQTERMKARHREGGIER